MSEIMEFYGSGLTELESETQDQITEKWLKYAGFVLIVGTGIILLSPYISNATTLSKNISKDNIIEYGDKTFSKLYTTKDYRVPKKLLKKKVKKVIEEKSLSLIKEKSLSVIKEVNIEFTPIVIDLDKICHYLFSKKTAETVSIVELTPEVKDVLLSRLVYSFEKTRNYLIVNRMALVTGGFIGSFFPKKEATLNLVKKGFDFAKKLVGKQKEEKEKEETSKKNAVGALAAMTGVLTNPLLVLPIVVLILVKGRLPLPKTTQEFDRLPEVVKPLFKKTNRRKRFVDYYVKPIFNFKTPVPYVVIGGIILYFCKGKVLAFITNKDDYKSVFGEITSIMMTELKTQFPEFGAFVKNTNSSLKINVRPETLFDKINKMFKPSNEIYHEQGIFDIT